MIRQMAADAKVSDSVRMEALEKGLPSETIRAVVRDHKLGRKRKLSAEIGLLIGIAMHLYRGCSLVQVL